MKIVLDAGHGPETPGKRCPDDSMREYHFNSVVARYADELLAGYENTQTLFTFEDSRDVPLKERTDKANAWKADLYVSIHANAFDDDPKVDGGWSKSRGVETFVYTFKNLASTKLAKIVQTKMVAMSGLYDRKVQAADFHVLRETKMTAVLVECGFMTNRAEAAMLKSDEYRRKCARAIVDGIAECYSLKKKPGPVKVDPNQWKEDAMAFLKDYAANNHDPDSPVTWAELGTILKKMKEVK